MRNTILPSQDGCCAPTVQHKNGGTMAGNKQPKEEQKKEQKKWGEKGAVKEEQKKPNAPKKILPEGVRGIVRIAETDLDGTKKIKSGLSRIKGIGIPLTFAITKAVGMDPNTVIGTLTDEQLAKLEAGVKDPAKLGIPAHMLDRRADPAEGINKHIVSSILTITKKFDIDGMRKIRCYKGVRHELGLPVRGQRTRCSGRTGMTAGVSRAKAQAAAPAGGPAAAHGEAKAAATTPAAPAAGGKAAAPSQVPAKGAAPAGKGAVPAAKTAAPAGKKPAEKK
jgi:small subunit ribosomal protein S13